jgi:integrase/recombinase XerC
LRAVERRSSTRDAAITAVLSNTAVRVSECAALDVEDVSLTARTGEVVVRQAKRDEYRRVPLNRAAREAVDAWLRERPEVEDADRRHPLFVNRAGGRLSARSIAKLIAQVGVDARIEGLSPHVLRHTCLTNLVRDGRDLVLVAEVAGHKRLETTRRYTRPDEAALREAMEALPDDR